MRKISKQTLDELVRTMTVIPELELSSYVGAYDERDCVWRCLAWVESGGTNYDRDAAFSLAYQYHVYTGDSTCFSPYSYEFAGTGNQIKDFAQQYITSSDGYSPTKILVFDPSEIQGWSGASGTRHAVIITGEDTFNLHVYDPQSGQNSTISRDEINRAQNAYPIDI